MPRINTTRVEELDEKFPGLRVRVDGMLDHRAKLEAVAAEIEKLSGEKLALSVVSSYKQRRWLPDVQRIQDITLRAAAVHEAYKRFGIGPIAEATALEQLDDVAPEVLLRESREHRKLDIEAGKLEVAREQAETAKREVELKLEHLQRQREREKREVERAVEENGANPEEFKQRIREIYGISGSGAANALSAPVD